MTFELTLEELLDGATVCEYNEAMRDYALKLKLNGYHRLTMNGTFVYTEIYEDTQEGRYSMVQASDNIQDL